MPADESEKDTKAGSRYEPVATGPDYCGICRYFNRSANTCTQVQGFISSRAWCRHFKNRNLKA